MKGKKRAAELEELEPAEASKEEEIKGFKKRKLDILERLTVAVGGASLDTDPPPSEISQTSALRPRDLRHVAER